MSINVIFILGDTLGARTRGLWVSLVTSVATGGFYNFDLPRHQAEVGILTVSVGV